MATIGTPQKSAAEQAPPADEVAFVADLERATGRKLTAQEAALAVEQARALGEL